MFKTIRAVVGFTRDVRIRSDNNHANAVLDGSVTKYRRLDNKRANHLHGVRVCERLLYQGDNGSRGHVLFGTELDAEHILHVPRYRYGRWQRIGDIAKCIRHHLAITTRVTQPANECHRQMTGVVKVNREFSQYLKNIPPGELRRITTDDGQQFSILRSEDFELLLEQCGLQLKPLGQASSVVTISDKIIESLRRNKK